MQLHIFGENKSSLAYKKTKANSFNLFSTVLAAQNGAK